MQFNVKAQTQARFKIVARNANTLEITKESSEFCNIVLNQGISRMLNDSWFGICQVGTGSSTPSKTQSQLDNLVAATSSRIGTNTYGVNIPESYIYGRTAFRFAASVAQGNLSEIGLGWGVAATNLWNRSLIKDVNNNPTTITVLSDEILDVYVELRLYVPQSITGTFNLVDKNNNFISSHTYTGAPKFTARGFFVNKLEFFGKATSGLPVFAGALPVDRVSDPTSPVGDGYVETITHTVPSFGVLRGVGKIGLESGNGIHRTITIPISGFMHNQINPFRYYVEINPPITLKNNTRTMEYTFEIELSAYEAT